MHARVVAYQKAVDAAFTREVEYGVQLGLERAGRAKREGKSPEEIVDEEPVDTSDPSGSLSPGSDEDDIIDRDHQTYEGGKWKWK